MKKWLSYLLMAIMILTITSGCSKSEKDSGGETDTQVSDTQKREETQIQKADSVENWPEKSINIVITSSAGGDGDYLMRLLAAGLEKELGVNLVLTNVTGGNGSVGMDDLMKKEPDGYTFYVNNTCALSANEANGLVDYDYTVSDPVGIFAKHS